MRCAVRFIIAAGICASLLGPAVAQEIPPIVIPATVAPASFGDSDEVAELRARLEATEAQIDVLRRRLDAALSPTPERLPFPPSPASESVARVSVALQDDETVIPPLPGNEAVSGGAPALADDLDSDPDMLQRTEFDAQQSAKTIGIDFYAPQEFDRGIVIRGRGAAMKIGGYVKADVIKDFNPISNTDAFDTRTIEVGARDRENARLHARQSRLNFDVRWPSDLGVVRTFVEADFFSDNNLFRLRHAYGEVGQIVVGQTWSTFANVRTLPATLDNEGSASVVNRRQAQVRWTQPLAADDWSVSLALEDPRILFNSESLPSDVIPETRSPDFVTRILYDTGDVSLQAASVVRQLAVQRGMTMASGTAWGLNLTGALLVSEADEFYFQITFGDGIGSYRDLPDIVTDGVSRGELLPMFAWMVGYTHAWTDNLASNLVYSESLLDNFAFQPTDDLQRNTYLAANLIWQPTERFFVGIEYLYGVRENVDGRDGEAHRLQTSFGFYLP